MESIYWKFIIGLVTILGETILGILLFIIYIFSLGIALSIIDYDNWRLSNKKFLYSIIIFLASCASFLTLFFEQPISDNLLYKLYNLINSLPSFWNLCHLLFILIIFILCFSIILLFYFSVLLIIYFYFYRVLIDNILFYKFDAVFSKTLYQNGDHNMNNNTQIVKSVNCSFCNAENIDINLTCRHCQLPFINIRYYIYIFIFLSFIGIGLDLAFSKDIYIIFFYITIFVILYSLIILRRKEPLWLIIIFYFLLSLPIILINGPNISYSYLYYYLPTSCFISDIIIMFFITSNYFRIWHVIYSSEEMSLKEGFSIVVIFINSILLIIIYCFELIVSISAREVYNIGNFSLNIYETKLYIKYLLSITLIAAFIHILIIALRNVDRKQLIYSKNLFNCLYKEYNANYSIINALMHLKDIILNMIKNTLNYSFRIVYLVFKFISTLGKETIKILLNNYRLIIKAINILLRNYVAPIIIIAMINYQALLLSISISEYIYSERFINVIIIALCIICILVELSIVIGIITKSSIKSIFYNYTIINPKTLGVIYLLYSFSTLILFVISKYLLSGYNLPYESPGNATIINWAVFFISFTTLAIYDEIKGRQKKVEK